MFILYNPFAHNCYYCTSVLSVEDATTVHLLENINCHPCSSEVQSNKNTRIKEATGKIQDSHFISEREEKDYFKVFFQIKIVALNLPCW